jgi:hypothetical protein
MGAPRAQRESEAAVLHDWQVALGRLVEARASGRFVEPDALDGLRLDDAERAWLRGVATTRGFALTSLVPRWWRETRARRGARLTLAALGDEAEATLAAYRREVPNFTLFYVSEGLAFAAYVERTAPCARVRAVARFEQAMWSVRQDAAAEEAPNDATNDGANDATNDAANDVGASSLRPHPAAAVIAFDAPAEPMLAALLAGAPLPAPTGARHHVLIAPGLPRRWREATAEEARVFHCCAPSATLEDLAAQPGSSVAMVAGLRAARALI